ncbi:ABC transporter family substrate-binding protein [Prauserella cavernicola]|uniref:ABC transporter family substrate-binding protein n=1 Tax=Prauserella cavernicola TaxID=2800127 RepID=UPI0027DBE5FE|nr:ABC transporter family substrate-binding protein [Prauserella cavernicola]
MFALVAVVLAACTNTPPPPVVSSPVAETSTPEAETPSQIVVSLDEIGGGYNPHNLADLSPVTSALAQMLLPSVFRPADDGTLELDENLMVSAEVTSEDPFTVSYEIRPEASWSDGAPIAVEDFAYLADAMKNQPGVADAAGYRLITGIQPGAGGKSLDVTFAEHYPGWQTLFDNLMPSHLLKDAPGGWQGALLDSFPAYGGPFSIKTLDKERGEIILERNERYWEKPAAVDRIVLRSSDQAGMVAALRSGNDQLSLATTDATGLELFHGLGEDVQLQTVARPYLATTLLRPVGALADDQVRAGVAALIDRDKLIAEGTRGGPSEDLRAGAHVRPPSSDDYRPTIPGSGSPRKPSPNKAERLLGAAGFTREAGTWAREGTPLSLVIASPGQQEPYASIAQELSRQLTAAGIEVTTVNPPARELFNSALPTPVDSATAPEDTEEPQPGAEDGAEGTDGTETPQPPESSETTTTPAPPPTSGNVAVDIAVVPQPVSSDPASTLASNYGCPPGWDDEPEADQPPEAAVTTAAFCDTVLQPTIDAALTGAEPLRDSLATVEPALWQSNVAIPLFQLADTIAIGSTVSGVTPGAPMAGPFSNAVDWIRAPR